MYRFLLRHGFVRLIGGRAVPVLMVWDLAVVANRIRRIPLVDRSLRRGAGAAWRGVGSAVSSRGRSVRRRRAGDPPGRTGA
jgi:hypothetical protein